MSPASPLCDANKATSSSARATQVLCKGSKAPPFLFPKGARGRSQKRGESQGPHMALLWTSLWEGKHARARMASEEINCHMKQGARALGEPYPTPSTALHQQPRPKLPPLSPETSENGGQRCRAAGSCEYQCLLFLLILLVHPLPPEHQSHEATMELSVAISPHLSQRHFQPRSAQLPPPPPSPGKPPDMHPEMSLSIC